MRALLVAALAAGFAPAPCAQDDGLLRLLADPPAAAAGDRDATAREIVARVREHPADPLAEAALRLLEAQFPDLDDPRALATEVRALDAAALSAAGLSPMATRQLQRLSGLLSVAHAPAEELGGDLFTGWLSRWSVLGPLPDAGDPLALRSDSPEFVDPGFEREHPTTGLDADPITWQALARSPLRPCVMAESVVDGTGWALLACCFDAPGGPAFVEVETSAAGGSAFPIGTATGGRGRVMSPFGGSGGDVEARAWSLSLNGERSVVVDPRGLEAPALRLEGVVLRAGRNRLMLSVPLGERTAFAVRVLGPDGLPLAGVVETRPGDALGTGVTAQPPSPAPVRSVDVLAALPQRGPDEEALLGLLLGLDGRPSEGLAHVVAAQAAAPERAGLAALLMRRTLAAGYLPDSWRRSRARALAEQVLESDPHWMPMELHVAGLISDEDRESEAVEKLRDLAEALPARSDALLALASVYRKLDMEAPAEEALRRAVDRTPGRPEALRRLAEHLARHGRRAEALDLELLALRAGGASGRALSSAAARQASMGRGDQALALLREAGQRDDAPGLKLELADALADLGRLQEADALLATLVVRHPRWTEPCVMRADLAARRGDADAERTRLREALARAPSSRPVRERLRDLGDPDPAEELFAREAVDIETARRADGGGDSADSVVRLVDAAVLWVFDDGSAETFTQELFRVRDLQGCEQMGEMQASGETLSIATIKPDGTRREPVAVNGYVMPDLKPGDCVVSESRERRAAPSDGVLRCGAWTFASPDEPYVLSRYVIRLPAGLPLRLEGRNLEGVVTHVERIEGEGVVHVFEARNQPRVLEQPHAPPAPEWLPWVEFGMDDDVPRHLAELVVGAREPTYPTPEVRAAAQAATAGLSGDGERARALHKLVNDTLDQRGWQGATAALIGREGSGTFLYAALLSAADIPCELVWSRNVAPAADDEPDPPFVKAGWWANKLLVLVSPRDEAPAWCDMDSDTLPYGELMAEAPGAAALALPSRRQFTMPDVPLSEQPTFDYALDFVVAADGSAEVRATALPRGGLQWAFKEFLKDAPGPALKGWVAQVLTEVVPGLDLQRHDLPGLKTSDVPLTIEGSGRVTAFLDDDGRSLSCGLPVPPLELSARLAGGEGRRTLPWFEPSASVQATEARLTLDPALVVDEVPADVELSFGGGNYLLTIVREGEHVLRVQRRLTLPPLRLPAEGHAELAAFCARVDEAEAGRLRLHRIEVDPPAGGR